MNFYRPLGKVMFSETSVCSQGGRVSLVPCPFWGLWGRVCGGYGMGGVGYPSAGHCCGRYASYWNAFLLNIFCVIITTRKRSLGQGNVFTPVCQSFCSQWPPKRAVRILLECILVFLYLLNHSLFFNAIWQPCITHSEEFILSWGNKKWHKKCPRIH